MKVSYGGAMPGGETWCINPVFRLGTEANDTINVSDSMALSIATQIAALSVPTSLVGAMNSGSNVSTVRVEARSKAGVLESLAEAVKSPATAGNGTNPHPYQTAIVCSLRTASSGARGRGRLYWNATGQSIATTDLRITGANATSLLSGFKTLLSAMEGIVDTVVGVPCALAVWSRTGASVAVVTELRLGNVLDVQRRRRDALIEAFSSSSYP